MKTMGVRGRPGMRMIQSQGINRFHDFWAGRQRVQSCPKMCCEDTEINFLSLKSQNCRQRRDLSIDTTSDPLLFHWTVSFIKVSQQTFSSNIFGLHFHLNYTKAMSFLTHIHVVILCTTIVIDLWKNTMSIHQCKIIPLCKKTKILATYPLYFYNNKHSVTNYKLA